MVPSWAARAKLKRLGITNCDLGVPGDKGSIPVISFLTASYGEVHVDNSQVESFILQFKDQSCSLNSLEDTGLSPLHSAVLFDQPDLVNFLLKAGADPNQKIIRVGSAIDGMNVIEFANMLLSKKESPNLNKSLAILEQQRNEI